MEISGKILREVEFRDRLRGYDTDEVDEFLEKVAVGIDEIRAELVALRGQTTRVEPRVEPTPIIDDESIRRTLVLAQRTADMAINEAREETSHLVEEARSQSETLVTQAQDTARRLKDEAEFEAHERVDRLAEQRDRLERDIQSLAHLLGSERDRLTQSLTSALGFVTESLSVSDDMSRAVTNIAKGHDEPSISVPTNTGSSNASPTNAAPSVTPVAVEVPDVEDEINQDAATAFRPEGAPPVRRSVELGLDRDDAEANLDPDEALWARWAQGADVDLSADTELHDQSADARQFPFPRGGGQGA